jgi:hypothetical protein
MNSLRINKFIILISCLLLVLANIVIDHFYEPIGIDFTPILIIITTSLVILTPDITNILLQVVFVYIFIGLNDVGIKLFGGGMHDSEGLGFINVFALIGLIPALLILIIAIIRNKTKILTQKVISILLFALLIAVHFYLFQNLGLGRYYSFNN